MKSSAGDKIFENTFDGSFSLLHAHEFIFSDYPWFAVDNDFCAFAKFCILHKIRSSDGARVAEGIE